MYFPVKRKWHWMGTKWANAWIDWLRRTRATLFSTFKRHLMRLLAKLTVYRTSS